MVESPTRMKRTGLACAVGAVCATAACVSMPKASAAQATTLRASVRAGEDWTGMGFSKKKAPDLESSGALYSGRVGVADRLAPDLHVLELEALDVVQIHGLGAVGRCAKVAVADFDIGHRQDGRLARPVVVRRHRPQDH